MGLILDTSLFVADERNKLDLSAFLRAQGNVPTLISAITISELRQGILRAPEGRRRDERIRHVAYCLRKYKAVAFDSTVALMHAQIWADLESRGQRIGGNDLIIASTALCLRFEVATLNIGEFQRVSNLKVIDASPFYRPTTS